MFSGIIEALGEVTSIERNGTNLSFTIHSALAATLKVDQSVSHNGVCLTVEKFWPGSYVVTAVQETLQKTNLGQLQKGSVINLERSISLQRLLDGHLVQGHVDATGTCITREDQGGSWLFTFSYPENFRNLLVEKGSVTVNGVSLTAFNCTENQFSVAIIPYTFQHTNFHELQENDAVNLEFDIIGKYIQRMMEPYRK